MQTRYFFSAISAVVLLAAGCSGPAPAPQPEVQFRTELTIQDVMETIVDPSADFLWESVSTHIGPQGIVEKAPRTDEEWREVRRQAMILMEAANLLKISGRKVARPGTRSTAPGIEEDPEGTERLMKADMGKWNKATDELYDAAQLLFKAAEAKSADAILDSGNQLDEACESCHLAYWYPNQTKILQENEEALKKQ